VLVVGVTDLGAIGLAQRGHLKAVVVHESGPAIDDQDVAMLEISVHDLGTLESSRHIDPGIRQLGELL